uniref:Uncharacterized protein n=1 Tax=Arundo donax TaxID=35708 RepID=A0A0A9C307_ARUDO
MNEYKYFPPFSPSLLLIA